MVQRGLAAPSSPGWVQKRLQQHCIRDDWPHDSGMCMHVPRRGTRVATELFLEDLASWHSMAWLQRAPDTWL